MRPATAADARRDELRTSLVACASASIADGGLAALRARDLAACAGCSIGTIYNLVSDLDELVLMVARRTLAALDAHIAKAAATAEAPADRLAAWAIAYCRFAVANRNLWRALFEFRMVPARPFPDWFVAEQLAIFQRLETVLVPLVPLQSLRKVRARTLFSAVHGIVALGIEEKLVSLSSDQVEAELAAFVRTYIAGLERRGPCA